MAEENVNNDKQENQQANNNPEKAMDTPKEVEQSNDANIDEDFPGYPHYPAKDDILNPDNATKVDADVEKLSRSNKIPQQNLKDSEE